MFTWPPVKTLAASSAVNPRIGPGTGVNDIPGLQTSAPEEIRTPNLLIRSQMLYPLSYGRFVTYGV